MDVYIYIYRWIYGWIYTCFQRTRAPISQCVGLTYQLTARICVCIDREKKRLVYLLTISSVLLSIKTEGLLTTSDVILSDSLFLFVTLCLMNRGPCDP
jgi:hypothetical protein